jgi:hypothetical protein
VVNLESLGKDVCGVLVGSKGRVCLRLASKYDVEKHQKEKAMELLSLREGQGIGLVVLIQASDNSVYACPFIDATLLTEARLANWRTSLMCVAECVATFSLHKGDLEMQQPAESFAVDAVSEFTSRLQVSYQMIGTPKRTWFSDPEEKVPIKLEFLKLPETSPGNLGPSRDDRLLSS